MRVCVCCGESPPGDPMRELGDREVFCTVCWSCPYFATPPKNLCKKKAVLASAVTDEQFEEYRARILGVHPPLEIIRNYIANAVANGNLDPERASADILFHFEQNGYTIQ